MARETITRMIDDLDGGVAHETVKFSLDGQQYEIDLSTKNAKKLRGDLAIFVEHGSKVANRAVAAGRARGRTGAGDKDLARAIREWAQAQGYDIAPRGRLKSEVVAEYHRAGGR